MTARQFLAVFICFPLLVKGKLSLYDHHPLCKSHTYCLSLYLSFSLLSVVSLISYMFTNFIYLAVILISCIIFSLPLCLIHYCSLYAVYLIIYLLTFWLCIILNDFPYAILSIVKISLKSLSLYLHFSS